MTTDAEKNTEDLVALIAELPKLKQYAMWLVVELNLCHPTDSLSESCRRLLATPHDDRLHPALEELLTFFLQAEQQQREDQAHRD